VFLYVTTGRTTTKSFIRKSMTKPTKQIIIEAIIKQIEQGKATEKICAAICSKFQFTERTFYNHFKNAQEQHTLKQGKLKKKIDELDEQAAIEARKKHIMTAEERKEFLTKLIHGEIEVPYTEVKYNPAKKKFETIQFVELAGHQARISAIAELNKMEGDYAPTKIAPTDSKGNDIPISKFNDTDLNALAGILKRAHDA
jgi:hypothetical protein